MSSLFDICHFRVVAVTARAMVLACLCAFVWCPMCPADSSEIDRLYRRLADQPKDVELLESLRQSALVEQDASVKVDALVLYCLGSTYVGREKEAERIGSYLTTVHRDNPSVARLTPSKLEDTDSVKEAYRAMFVHVLGVDESAAPSNSVREADAEPAEKGAEWSSMSEYVEAVRVLRDRYKSGTISTADLQTVFAEPVKYTGQVLRCTVQLQDYHMRAILVSAEPDAAKGGSAVLSPDTIWIGSKAGQIIKECGSPASAVVTFGLLTADQNILFDVEKPEGAPPAGQ